MDSRYQKIYLISLARVYAFTNNRDYIAYVDNSWRNTLGTICQMIDEEIDWAEQARLTSVVMVLTESGSCPENVASTLVSSRYTPEHLEPRSQAIYIQVVADLYAFDNNRSWAYAAFERWDSADETICELRLNQPDVSYQARLNHLAALLNGVGCE